MNVRRFVARSSREALAQVRQAFGDDAVILSTRPDSEGVEVLAMPADSVQALEHYRQPRADSPGARPEPEPEPAALPRQAAPARTAPAAPAVPAPRAAAGGVEVGRDVERLAMSTLSFQDYVRERMLKRRQAALGAPAAAAAPPEPRPQAATPVRGQPQVQPQGATPVRGQPQVQPQVPMRMPPPAQPQVPPPAPAFAPFAPFDPAVQAPPEPPAELPPEPAMLPSQQAVEREQRLMLNELREMRGMIEERFGALAFMERFQRSPVVAGMTRKLLDCGFSPALIRKLAQAAPAGPEDLLGWCAGVLERNLDTGEGAPGIEDLGGTWALIGSTGVGKTTSCAKIAAAFAAKYGAANLGLVTLDAYRVGAHEQLRAYGRILGCAVHTAHDRAALEDLLGLLAGKKMVLIDTAGIAQRDSRTRELLEMVSDRSIQRLLVVNASAQGETIEDVLVSYRAAQCRGVVLSKLDEAVKLGPALDAMIRHKLRVLGVANGQRVPEDWHRLSTQALVQRALRGGGSPAYRLDSDDVSLVFTAPAGPGPGAGAGMAGGNGHV